MAGKALSLDVEDFWILFRAGVAWLHVDFKQIEQPSVWHARDFAFSGASGGSSGLSMAFIISAHDCRSQSPVKSNVLADDEGQKRFELPRSLSHERRCYWAELSLICEGARNSCSRRAYGGGTRNSLLAWE